MTPEEFLEQVDALNKQIERTKKSIDLLAEYYGKHGPVKKGQRVLLRELDRYMLWGGRNAAKQRTPAIVDRVVLSVDNQIHYAIVTVDGGCYLGSYTTDEFDLIGN